jgi:hypothetical protein
MNINVDHMMKSDRPIAVNEAHTLHQEDARIDAREDMMYMQVVA